MSEQQQTAIVVSEIHQADRKGVVVRGQGNAALVAQFLVRARSAWFEVTPLPDDEYRVLYPPEDHAALREQFGRPCRRIETDSEETVEHKVIDANECPRCHGHNTEALGDDGSPTVSYLCLDCQKKGGEDHDYYDVVYVSEIECVIWRDGDDERTVYDSAFLVQQAARDLLASLGTMAAQAARVVESWESGDLARAVRELDDARRKAGKIIARAKGEQS